MSSSRFVAMNSWSIHTPPPEPMVGRTIQAECSKQHTLAGTPANRRHVLNETDTRSSAALRWRWSWPSSRCSDEPHHVRICRGGPVMTLTLPALLVLIVIAAICGAVGKSLAGGGPGGLVASIALGFIGALLGPWVAHQFHLPDLGGRGHHRVVPMNRTT